MAYPRFGDYEAVVTDNSEFYKRGFIRVRVAAFYNEKVPLSLTENYNEEEFNAALAGDLRCLVTMPIGGGNGHGMFSLPQVNSVGYVSFLNGDIKKAIWKGTIIQPKYDDEGKFVSANVPNDQLSKEGPGSEGVTVNGKQVKTDGGGIIIRQKSTNNDSADDMDWDKNRTENLAVLNDNNLSLIHVEEWDEDNYIAKKYYEINVHEETNSSSENYGETVVDLRAVTISDSGTNEYGLEIVDGKVRLKAINESSKITNEVSIDEDEVLLKSNDNNRKRTTTVSATPTQIVLNGRDSTITVGDRETNIYGKNLVTISGSEIRLGGMAEEYVVTSPIPFTAARMEDGHVLNAAGRAKA